MARRQKASFFEDVARLIVIAILMGYGALAGFWKSLAPADRTLFVVLAVAALLVGIALVVLILRYRKQKRREAWTRAMRALSGGPTPFPKQEGGSGTPARLPKAAPSVKFLDPLELEKFAAQVYRKMGYRAGLTDLTGDHGMDVRLSRPDNRVEIVQCKQWKRPVGEKEVRDLMGAMVHEKAVKGYLWAPGGFSQPARQWARGKPIQLLDEAGIDRLVEVAYGEG